METKKVGEDQKKGPRGKISGFSVHMSMETKQNEKKGLHHKLVELWFNIIKWCHPKMVTPGVGRPS